MTSLLGLTTITKHKTLFISKKIYKDYCLPVKALYIAEDVSTEFHHQGLTKFDKPLGSDASIPRVCVCGDTDK